MTYDVKLSSCPSIFRYYFLNGLKNCPGNIFKITNVDKHSSCVINTQSMVKDSDQRSVCNWVPW